MRDSENRKASDARYRDSEKGRATLARYKHSEEGRAVIRAYQNRYKRTDMGKANHLRQVRKARQRAIAALGGKCVHCGFDDWRALQIDHVNGGGCREEKQIGGHGIIRKVLRGETEGYQLLCANCNWIKFYEKKEYNGSALMMGN